MSEFLLPKWRRIILMSHSNMGVPEKMDLSFGSPGWKSYLGLQRCDGATTSLPHSISMVATSSFPEVIWE